MSISTAHMAWPTLVEVLVDRARRQSDQVGYRFLNDAAIEDDCLTYGELDAAARRIAVALQSRGNSGDRVLLLYPPGLEFIRGFFGCLYAGMIAVPAFPPSSSRSERSTERLSAIVRNAQPSAILTSERAVDMVTAANLGVPLVLRTDGLTMGSESAWRAPNPDRHAIACLQFTSGSTSTPKGVVLTHSNLLHNSGTIAEAFEHSEKSVGVNWLPPYHDMGLIGGVLQPLYVGFPNVLMAPATFLQKPMRWLAAISNFRGTTCGAPDFAYDLCVKSAKPEDIAALDLSCWDVAFSGAEPIRSRTLQRFAETFKPCGFRLEAFYPCYGLAEATLMVTGGRKADAPVFQPVLSDLLRHNRIGAPNGQPARVQTLVGCGKPRSDHRVAIVDPQTRREVPLGCIGEIWVAGGGVAQGYWNQPELSAQAFDATLDGEKRHQFLRTGDLGCFVAGELLVTGRIKDLVIVRGVKHYPHDIEQTVQSSHAALEGCAGAAFALEDDHHEHLVIAHEVQRSQRNANPDEILSAIRQRVAERHEIQPHAILLLKPGQIRRTSSGKIRRQSCRMAYLNAEFDAVATWTASNGALQHESGAPQQDGLCSAVAQSPEQALEQWLMVQLAEAVGMAAEHIDPAEPFARYGLDSANAVSLAGAVADKVDRDLPATLFWDYPSARSLAQVLVREYGVSDVAPGTVAAVA